MNSFTRKAKFAVIALSAACLFPQGSRAQLSTNPDKFLGNITTRYQVDYGKEKFYTLWNQITCENESKWSSVEGNRNSYNWQCDNAFNYAKQHKFPHKFHALIWGAQYPGWLPDLPVGERFNAIVKWFDAVKKKYPTLPLIDVVNEAVGMHQQGNPMMKESLGGGGKTGYDNLIKAFEMAFERWPDAILIYNDYNTFQWDTDNYIDLVRTLRDAGAPIDAYGCQSHDLTDCSFSKFKTSEQKLQNSLKMPMYSTEYDIGTDDNALQEQRYKEQIPYMWEKDYCAGITLWGYIYGATWTDHGNSGLIRDNVDRPAMKWLRTYMKSEAAKTAKGPFPNMKKEVSVYIKPAELKVAKGDVLPILVRTHVSDNSKQIEKVELYVANKLEATMTEAPYKTEYTVPSSSAAGWKDLKAVVTTTDGSTYVRYGRFNVLSNSTKREPYNGNPAPVPGLVMGAEYDKGASGVAYSNASRTATSVTKDGAWMEYTVNVAEDGIYAVDAEVAASRAGGLFHLCEYGLENLLFLSDFIEVPATGGTSKFKTMTFQLKTALTAGQHSFCLNVDKGGFIVKSFNFRRYEQDKGISVTVSSLKPSSTVSVGDTAIINVTAKKTDANINNVKVYANGLLIATLTEAPYTLEFVPEEKGSYTITAVATTDDGKENTSAKKTLKVNGKRTPYKSIISIPGVIEAENFDKGGEGLSFHDSDSNREGDTNYRTDSEGVDFVKGNNGTCIGYTASGEWLDYSIDVKQRGKYTFEATVSSGTTNSGFSFGLVNGTKVTTLATIDVPQTGNNDWGSYTVVKGELSKELEEGQQVLRISITGSNCNIDKLELKCIEDNGIAVLNSDVSKRPRIVYNLSGQKVGPSYKGLIIRNGKKVLKK